jgi:predicted RNA binding protein YcfA (HicA-like mRNA interferase family)
MIVPKKAKALVEAAKKYGFVLHRRNKHLIFKHPSGAILVSSATASDWRAVRNLEQNAKKILAEG